MDEGKILVVNLSKGLIGEDNAGILGAFIVTKVQLAAMSRSDIPDVMDRRPFYLYVDEFQNFATDSFAVILSEARKYGLNLTVANQYVAQMTDTVRDAVFGNVGTTISFRVSPEDAPILVKQFEPTFEESDLIQLNNRNFVISMIIGGEKVPAFSASTLSIPETPSDNFDAIVAHSREYYGRPRLEVEAEIRETIEQSEKYKRTLSDSGRQVPQMVISNGAERPIFAPVKDQGNTEPKRASVRTTEQKPNLRRISSPQEDLRRSGLSPNAAEGKERLGLKDLARMVSENGEGNVKFVNQHSTKKGNQKHQKGKRNHKKYPGSSHPNPVKSNPVPSQVNPAPIQAKPTVQPSSTPVRPQVEYQEKTSVTINPSHNSLPLSTPVKDAENYAERDNSVDGFLSIKH